jgi:preprotein translocase subunit SecE
MTMVPSKISQNVLQVESFKEINKITWLIRSETVL